MNNHHTSAPKATKYQVSAIVSAYNSEKFMAGRLQNLIDQSLYLKNQLEIVVVDSGSQQNEGQIVREFMQQFNHIIYLLFVVSLKLASVTGAVKAV